VLVAELALRLARLGHVDWIRQLNAGEGAAQALRATVVRAGSVLEAFAGMSRLRCRLRGQLPPLGGSQVLLGLLP